MQANIYAIPSILWVWGKMRCFFLGKIGFHDINLGINWGILPTFFCDPLTQWHKERFSHSYSCGENLAQLLQVLSVKSSCYLKICAQNWGAKHGKETVTKSWEIMAGRFICSAATMYLNTELIRIGRNSFMIFMDVVYKTIISRKIENKYIHISNNASNFLKQAAFPKEMKFCDFAGSDQRNHAKNMKAWVPWFRFCINLLTGFRPRVINTNIYKYIVRRWPKRAQATWWEVIHRPCCHSQNRKAFND